MEDGRSAAEHVTRCPHVAQVRPEGPLHADLQMKKVEMVLIYSFYNVSASMVDKDLGMVI